MNKLTVLSKLGETKSLLTPIKEVVLEVEYQGKNFADFINNAGEKMCKRNGILQFRGGDQQQELKVIFNQNKIDELRLLNLINAI